MRKYYYLGESMELYFTSKDMSLEQYTISATLQGYSVPVEIVNNNSFRIYIPYLDSEKYKEGRADILLSFYRGNDSYIGKSIDLFFVDPKVNRPVDTTENSDPLSINLTIDNNTVEFSLFVGHIGKDSFQIWKELPGNENATLEDWLDWQRKFDPINNSIDIRYRFLAPDKNNYVIDLSIYRNVEIHLEDNYPLYNIQFKSLTDGITGRILVVQKDGDIKLAFNDAVVGGIDMTYNRNTVFIIDYFVKEMKVYVSSRQIVKDIVYKIPQKIADLSLVYADTNTIKLKFTAPYANDIYDKVDFYELKYSNNLINPEDPKAWAGLNLLPTREPLNVGELEEYTFSKMRPGTEYYIYVKSVKINKGLKFISTSSDVLYVKTAGVLDSVAPIPIMIDSKDIYPQTLAYSKNGDTRATEDLMVDEDLVVITDGANKGYPDTANKAYSTYWLCDKAGRDTSPYSIIIELLTPYDMDKMFLYSSTKLKVNIYTMEDFGYNWVNNGSSISTNNTWLVVNLIGKRARFVKISFENINWGAKAVPAVPSGVEGWPFGQTNDSIERINRIAIYGKPVNNIPLGIRPPLKRLTTKRTFDEWFCTNAHAYQPGRIQSLVSGPLVRLYLGYTYFSPKDEYNTTDDRTNPFWGFAKYEKLKDWKFRLNHITWVSNQNTGYFLQNNMVENWKRWGLKPYFASADTFKPVYANVANKYNVKVFSKSRQVDGYWPYWNPQKWFPTPKGGYGGIDDFYAVTKDALNYKIMAKLGFAIAAKYGNVAIPQEDLPVYHIPTLVAQGKYEPLDTGLGIIGGLEPENEPNHNWRDWPSYESAEEYAALHSAFFDGHGGMIVDEDGQSKYYGVRKADSGLYCISSGLAGNNPSYFFEALLWWRANRPNKDIPVDAFAVHVYCSTAGNQTGSSDPIQYGITYEKAIENYFGTGKLRRMIEFRDRYAPDKEIWVNEFGYGEAGGRNTISTYQCYSMPGKRIGNWLIPDRHRSEVKAAWLLRGCIQMMNDGVDLLNYYITYNEMVSWFHPSTGAGFEMWDWFKEPSLEPGVRYNAIQQGYETTGNRGGFAAMGLFGGDLASGGYPISNTVWWLRTFRNRLKGYIFTGFKKDPYDTRIIIACFRKLNDNKGAYVVYLNNDENDGVPGVVINIPAGVNEVKKIDIYLPNIPDPRKVPHSLGIDRQRTGLPTTRREIVNGEEVVIFPTAEENPYFPIVGPVGTFNSLCPPSAGVESGYLYANTYLTTELVNGQNMTVKKYDNTLQWRQSDAICDFIESHPEGIKGSYGIESNVAVNNGTITVNISEFPDIYLFDGIPVPDFDSTVTELSAIAISPSEVELWWNNNNPYDTHYEIFVSNNINDGYVFLKKVSSGLINKASVNNLDDNTTYYFKIRPLRDEIPGNLSEAVGVKTFTDLAKPTNLEYINRTAGSITLSWQYTNEVQVDFTSFGIYRATNGDFKLIGKVESQYIRTFEDRSNLASGITYSYKIRALGNNGVSAYSDELSVRTLLATEVSPMPMEILTDKEGTKIVVIFDLAIGLFNSDDVKADFILTENDQSRLIKSVSRDQNNTNRINIYLFPDTIQTYDKRTIIKLAYNPSLVKIKSEFDIDLLGFSAKRVANYFGNYTNIEHIYRINFGPDSSYYVDGWNNLLGLPTTLPKVTLNDDFGQPSLITVEPLKRTTAPKLDWGSANVGGLGTEDIPQEVYNSFWTTSPYATSDEILMSRLRFANLDPQKKYNIRAFGSSSQSSTPPIESKIKVNGLYSNSVAMSLNTNNFMTLEDCVPSSSGELFMDLIPAMAATANKQVRINYLILEECSIPPYIPNDVFIRSYSIDEDADNTGDVLQEDIHITLNTYGVATHYRISENLDFTNALWIETIANSQIKISHSLTKFGSNTLYVQLKNTLNESNVKVVTINYVDTHINVQMQSLIINDGNPSTTDINVNLYLQYLGQPTHFRIAESVEAIPNANWEVFVSNNILYNLSSGYGNKNIYVQIKDSRGESNIIGSLIAYIQYIELALQSIIINLGEEATTSNIVSVNFNYTGSPTHYMMSEDPAFVGSTWLPFNPTVNFTLSAGVGNKTIHARIKDAVTITDSVFDFIEKQAIELKAIVSFTGSSNNPLYPVYNNKTINKISIGINETYNNVPIKDESGAAFGSYVVKPSLRPSDSTIQLFNNSTGANPVLSGNTGIYPDEYLSRANYPNNANVSTNRGLIRFNVPNGNYKIKILSSRVASITDANRQACLFKANNSGNVQLVTTAIGNNNSIFTEITSVVVSDGILDIYAWNINGQYNMPVINLIEIINIT